MVATIVLTIVPIEVGHERTIVVKWNAKPYPKQSKMFEYYSILAEKEFLANQVPLVDVISSRTWSSAESSNGTSIGMTML